MWSVCVSVSVRLQKRGRKLNRRIEHFIIVFPSGYFYMLNLSFLKSLMNLLILSCKTVSVIKVPLVALMWIAHTVRLPSSDQGSDNVAADQTATVTSTTHVHDANRSACQWSTSCSPCLIDLLLPARTPALSGDETFSDHQTKLTFEPLCSS